VKVIIPSYNRAKTISTPYLDVFKNFDIYILVHNDSQKDEYIKHNPKLNIICTNVTTANDEGLPRQRKWAVDNLLEHNEWTIFADDNIKEIHGIVNDNWLKDEILEPNLNDWGSLTNKQFIERIEFLSNYGDNSGAYHIGFLPAHNFYFARKKIKHYGFCMGKMTMWKKDNDFVWNNIYMNAVEDFNHTAMHLINYGIVLIHDYLYPHAYHYQSGGAGSKAYRKNIRKRNIKVLTTLYPDLIKKKKRKNGYPDARIVYMSKKNFINWRNKYINFLKEYTFDIDNVRWVKND